MRGIVDTHVCMSLKIMNPIPMPIYILVSSCILLFVCVYHSMHNLFQCKLFRISFLQKFWGYIQNSSFLVTCTYSCTYLFVYSQGVFLAVEAVALSSKPLQPIGQIWLMLFKELPLSLVWVFPFSMQQMLSMATTMCSVPLSFLIILGLEPQGKCTSKL